MSAFLDDLRWRGLIAQTTDEKALSAALAKPITCYIGLRREYFPEFFFARDLIAKLGFSRKNGRSSGDDGNGPAGQH